MYVLMYTLYYIIKSFIINLEHLYKLLYYAADLLHSTKKVPNHLESQS